MGLGWIKNLTTLFKYRKELKVAANAANEVKEAYMKDGIKTTEFWGKTLVQILTVIITLKPESNIDPQSGIIIVAGIEALYNLLRTLIKTFVKK